MKIDADASHFKGTFNTVINSVEKFQSTMDSMSRSAGRINPLKSLEDNANDMVELTAVKDDLVELTAVAEDLVQLTEANPLISTNDVQKNLENVLKQIRAMYKTIETERNRNKLTFMERLTGRRGQERLTFSERIRGSRERGSFLDNALGGITAIGMTFGLDKIYTKLKAIVQTTMDVIDTARKLDDSASNLFKLRYALVSIGLSGEEALEAITAISRKTYLLSLGDIKTERLYTALGLYRKLDEVTIRPKNVQLSQVETPNSKALMSALGAGSVFANKMEELKKIRQLSNDINNDIRLATPTDQFLRTAEALARITDNEQRAVAAMELYGDSAHVVLRAVAKDLNNLKSNMDLGGRLGLNITNGELLQIEAGRQAIRQLNASLEAFGMQLATRIAPLISLATELLKGMFPDDMKPGEELAKIANGIMGAVKYIISGFYYMKVALYSIVVGGLLAADAFNKALNAVVQFAMAAKMIDGVAGAKMLGSSDVLAEDLKKQIDEYKALAKSAYADAAVEPIQTWIDKKLKNAMDRVQKASELQKGIGDLEKTKIIFRFKTELEQETESPLEKLEDRLRLLDQMRDKYAFNERVRNNLYGRGILDIIDKTEQLLALQDIRSPGAALMNSMEEASIITKAKLEQDVRGFDKAVADRLQRAIDASTEVQRQIEENTRKAAEAGRNRVQIMIP